MNLFWNYGKFGAKISATIAVLGTFLNALLGGCDKILCLLIFMMVCDFLLGILAAVKSKKLDSRVMFWGGINKILVLMLIGLAVRLDNVLPMEEPYIRTAVIWFYSSREGLSVVENYGKLGMPLPPFLVNILQQLKEKSNSITK